MQEIILPLNTNLEIFSKVNKNRYFVSNYGYIIDSKRNMVVLRHTTGNLVICALMGENKYSKTASIKKVVLITFDYRPDYNERNVIAIDGNENNCALYNLVWDDFTRNNRKLLCNPSYNNIPINESDEVWIPLTDRGVISEVNTRGYYISNYGRIFNKQFQKFIGGSLSSTGYMRVTLPMIVGGYKGFFVHRLVLNAFKPISNFDKMQVNHINGIKTDNRLCNLEWATCQDNINDAYRIGLKTSYGENNSSSVYKVDVIHAVLIDYLNGMDMNELINKYSDIGSYDLVMEVCGANYRLYDIISLMVSYNYVPSIILTPIEYQDAIRMANDQSINSNIYLKYFGFTRHNTPYRIKRLVLCIIFSIIHHGRGVWIEYINL